MAYADEQLDPQRRHEVEVHLSNNPVAARFIRDVIEQNKIIRGRFAYLLDDPVPERLEQVLYRSQVPARLGFRIAAAIVLLLVSGLSGAWLGVPASSETDDVTNAIRQA